MDHHEALATCQRFGFEPISAPRSPSVDLEKEFDRCVDLLEGIREFEQHKGLELANQLTGLHVDFSGISSALLRLARRSKNVEIRKKVVEAAISIGDDKLIWDCATELSIGTDKDQEQAIRLFSSLQKKLVRNTLPEIRRIVDFAADYGRRKVQFIGLEELTKFGDVDAPYELYLLVKDQNDSDSKELASRLLLLAAKRGNKNARLASL